MIQSAGILVFRRSGKTVEVLLVHPGGPFWGKKDTWSIPKGELEVDEDLLSGAKREFIEEIGAVVPAGELLSLGEAKQGSGKVNHIWAVEGDVDLSHFDERRNEDMVTVEWPPKSGKQVTFAENDKAEWIALSLARSKVFKNQAAFMERLAAELQIDLDEAPLEPPEATQQSLL
jgi:predicted NUDIX family NTP pyrophosphohydrolase